MANKHILRIHETESDLLSELKDKQIAWATDINEAIWRNGNNFYYIEASKYWNGSEFIEINSDQIYNVYNWDDYLTALSDVGNIKYIYMRENIQAPSVLTQNIDVYGQCEIIVYTGSQIFSFDPSGASNCELRYRGASGSPNFTSLNFLGNSMAYVGFETLFIEDVYCRNEDIISSLPIDVQITNGAELGTPKFQYESQDGNFTCSVGTSDFIRELWTVPIFEIETIGSAEGYKPKGTDFLNNGSSVYSNMSQADISENFVGDVYTDAFLGLIFTTSQLSGLLRKRFIGGSVLWSFNNLDVWNPSTFSDNPISFIGRGIDFTSGVSIDEDKLCSLTLAPSTSNATLKIGDITDTQNDIYVEVLNIDGDVTLDPTSTHNIYYEKINLNGFTLTDSGNVAVQQFWNNTNDSSGGGSQDLDSVLTQGNTTGDDSIQFEPFTTSGLSDYHVVGKVFNRLDLFLSIGPQIRQYSPATSGVHEFKYYISNDLNSSFITQFDETSKVFKFRLGGNTYPKFQIGSGSNNNIEFIGGSVSSDFRTIIKDGTLEIEAGVFKLGSTTNASPTDGDIWYDGSDTNIEGSVIVGSDSFVEKTSSVATFQVGDNVDTTTNSQSGWKAQSDAVGDVNVDHKTFSGRTIKYRCGEGTEQGFARTFMEVDPTNGSVAFQNKIDVGGDNNASKWSASPFTPITSKRASFVGRDSLNEADIFTNVYFDGAFKSIGSGSATRFVFSQSGAMEFFQPLSNPTGSNQTVNFAKTFEVSENQELIMCENSSSTTNSAGWQVRANKSNGTVAVDHKIEGGAGFYYRYGEGSEAGSSNLIFYKDAGNPELNFEMPLQLNNIPTGTQVGLVGYDANGKLIQGTGGGGGVTPGAWTNVTLASNISVRSGYRPLRYRSDGIDGVQVEGTCKYNTGFNLSPGFTVVLFTFASGSRPNNDFNVKAQVGYNGATAEIDAWAHIDASTGQVTLKNSDAVAISELYDISFNFRFSLT